MISVIQPIAKRDDSSEPDRLAVLPRVEGRTVAMLQQQDELRSAKDGGRLSAGQDVAATLQFFPDFGRERRLQRQGGIFIDIPARRIRGRLGILAPAEDTDHQLEVSLDLHVSTHHAKTHQGFAVAARGCEVATTFDANTGILCQG